MWEQWAKSSNTAKAEDFNESSFVSHPTSACVRLFIVAFIINLRDAALWSPLQDLHCRRKLTELLMKNFQLQTRVIIPEDKPPQVLLCKICDYRAVGRQAMQSHYQKLHREIDHSRLIVTLNIYLCVAPSFKKSFGSPVLFQPVTVGTMLHFVEYKSYQI